MIKKPEILAPAGSMESLIAGIRCGADAIYLGSKSFSARANATNFDEDELKTACEIAHKSGVKIYQTLNTLVFDTQLESVKKSIVLAANAGVDALIVQDLGIAQTIKEICPNMHIHASTQMTIHTPKGALLAKESGFSRVVVAREVSKEVLSQIIATGIEVEYFVHGALCMSISGQCFMSAMIGSRSANRGQCAQACRLPFSAIEGEKRCDLSLKDLSLVEYIGEMAELGVASLKIEGRMKRPEYVAASVTACRSSIDGEKPDLETLKAVFSRSGFTDGYYTNNLGNEMFGTRQKDDVVSAEGVLSDLASLYRKEAKRTTVDFYVCLKENLPTKIIATDSQGNKVEVLGDTPQKALNRPTDIEQLKKQLSKLGDTIYNLGEITAEIDEGIMLPASLLNNLRREACDNLDNARIMANTPKYEINKVDINFPKMLNIKPVGMRLEITKLSQLEKVELEDFEYIYLPLEECLKSNDFEHKDMIIVSLPRYTKEENSLIEKISKAKELGFSKALCTNYSHIKICKEQGLVLFGGFSLNVTNSYSLKSLADYGLKDATTSFELKLNQISSLADFMPYGIIAYGRLPLMLTVNCPIKQAVGCAKCDKHLTDRTGRKFEVLCGGDAVEILNCDYLYMADRLHEVNDVSFITLRFTNETPQQIAKIVQCYQNRSKPPYQSFTRGLYYRGII